MFRFFENSKKFPFLKIIIFVVNLKTKFEIFQIWKIRDNSLIETIILNLLSRTNRFYLLKCSRDSISRKPLFLLKTGKT